MMKNLGYNQITVVKLNLNKQDGKSLNITLSKIKGKWDIDKLKTVINFRIILILMLMLL